MSPIGWNQVQYFQSKMILQVVMSYFCLSSNTGSAYMSSGLPVSFSHHVGGFSQVGMLCFVFVVFFFSSHSAKSISVGWVDKEKNMILTVFPPFELYAERDGFNRRPLPLHTKGERALCDWWPEGPELCHSPFQVSVPSLSSQHVLWSM